MHSQPRSPTWERTDHFPAKVEEEIYERQIGTTFRALLEEGGGREDVQRTSKGNIIEDESRRADARCRIYYIFPIRSSVKLPATALLDPSTS